MLHKFGFYLTYTVMHGNTKLKFSKFVVPSMEKNTVSVTTSHFCSLPSHNSAAFKQSCWISRVMTCKKVIRLCSVNEITPHPSPPLQSLSKAKFLKLPRAHTHMCTVEQGTNMMKPLSTVYRTSKPFCRQSFDMVSIDLVPCVYSL